jgi:hypothetical protein
LPMIAAGAIIMYMAYRAGPKREETDPKS